MPKRTEQAQVDVDEDDLLNPPTLYSPSVDDARTCLGSASTLSVSALLDMATPIVHAFSFRGLFSWLQGRILFKQPVFLK